MNQPRCGLVGWNAHNQAIQNALTQAAEDFTRAKYNKVQLKLVTIKTALGGAYLHSKRPISLSKTNWCTEKYTAAHSYLVHAFTCPKPKVQFKFPFKISQKFVHKCQVQFD